MAQFNPFEPELKILLQNPLQLTHCRRILGRILIIQHCQITPLPANSRKILNFRIAIQRPVRIILLIAEQELAIPVRKM